MILAPPSLAAGAPNTAAAIPPTPKPESLHLPLVPHAPPRPCWHARVSTAYLWKLSRSARKPSLLNELFPPILCQNLFFMQFFGFFCLFNTKFTLLISIFPSFPFHPFSFVVFLFSFAPFHFFLPRMTLAGADIFQYKQRFFLVSNM